mmetsp:Transcript_49856/g.88592  ORF Transcript_49856/g.88592 Transcript_49856/m.88592 type:complete len:330 (-) Transcript_49856:29-1018(-)
MESVERVRCRPQSIQEEMSRCRFRVINLPGERGRLRREHIQVSCLDRLKSEYPELDVGFTDGIVARELHWDSSVGSHQHSVHTTEFNGQQYVADEELWCAPTRNQAENMRREFAQRGWIPPLWTAFLQDCSEPNSWGYVGCQLAHVEAWRAAYEAGVDWLMICEDDVCPVPLFDMDWTDIWGVVAQQIHELRKRGEHWHLLFVGKGSSVSPEGKMVTPLIAECGYNIKMHCYCISREGLQLLLPSALPYHSIRPQDEILASLNVQGCHPRAGIAKKIRQLFPGVDTFRSLCFPWWGIVFQLQYFEQYRDSEMCRSAIGELGQEGRASGR